jgi:hypothetical protein
MIIAGNKFRSQVYLNAASSRVTRYVELTISFRDHRPFHEAVISIRFSSHLAASSLGEAIALPSGEEICGVGERAAVKKFECIKEAVAVGRCFPEAGSTHKHCSAESSRSPAPTYFAISAPDPHCRTRLLDSFDLVLCSSEPSGENSRLSSIVSVAQVQLKQPTGCYR